MLDNWCPNNQKYELQVQSIAEAALAEQNEMISGRQKARGAQNGRYGGVGGFPGAFLYQYFHHYSYYINCNLLILTQIYLIMFQIMTKQTSLTEDLTALNF